MAKKFNTTNMIDHLQKKYSVEYKDYEGKKKLDELKEQNDRRQPTMEETRARVKIWDINDPKAEHIHCKIAEMMALDYQPLSVINDVGFTCILQSVKPKYKILVESTTRIMYCPRSRKQSTRNQLNC